MYKTYTFIKKIIWNNFYFICRKIKQRKEIKVSWRGVCFDLAHIGTHMGKNKLENKHGIKPGMV